MGAIHTACLKVPLGCNIWAEQGMLELHLEATVHDIVDKSHE